MNLRQARTLAIDLMNLHNLIGWRFRYDRAVRRLGYTQYGSKTISLSRALTVLNDEPQVKNTILHEIAHALLGAGHGHNNVWRSKAISIGCNGQRCTNSIVKVQPRFKIICALCGTSWPCHRKPRQLDYSFHKSCGKASMGKLSVWTA